MTGEMNILPLPPTTPATVRPQVGELLKLLTPVEGLIGAGQSAKAEVLSLKQADQTFQLLLKVTLDNGRQHHGQFGAKRVFERSEDRCFRRQRRATSREVR